MWVCSCFAFNDGKVKEVLDTKDGEAIRARDIQAKDIHKECSGADKPQCGSCLKTISDMMKEKAADTSSVSNDQADVPAAEASVQEPIRRARPQNKM